MMMTQLDAVPGERILVIDDEDIFRLLLKRLLAAEGYSVEAARDGIEAESFIRREHYDAILLDLAIPEIGGVDILKFIRKHDQSVVVIIVSGDSDIRSAIECIKLGATDYIIKPIEPDALITLIRTLLDARALRNSLVFDDRAFAAQLFRIISTSFENTIEGLDRLSRDQEHPLNEPQRKICTSLSDTLRHTLIMSTDILQLSGCMKAGPEHSRISTHLGTLIDEVCQRFLLLARAKHITLRWSLNDDLVPVMLNPESIECVLTAILHHAVHSTGRDGTITISGGHATPPREGMMVTIQHDGDGIPPEKLSTLFKVYHEPQSNTPPETSLNLLGLALCGRIIESHKGEIWASSDTMKGSEIHFTLPV